MGWDREPQSARPPLALEKAADGARESLRLVGGNRVAGAGNLHEAAVRQRVDHPLGDLRREHVAVGPAHEQGRHGDPAERLPEVDRLPPSALSHHVAKGLVIFPLPRRDLEIPRGAHRLPHTSCARPTQSESFARSSATVTSLPSTVEEKPHWGLTQSWSRAM